MLLLCPILATVTPWSCGSRLDTYCRTYPMNLTATPCTSRLDHDSARNRGCDQIVSYEDPAPSGAFYIRWPA